MNIVDNLLAELNKCETIKSHENVRYTLIDDELLSYIEDELEHFKELRSAVEKEIEILIERKEAAYLFDELEFCNIYNTIIEELDTVSEIINHVKYQEQNKKYNLELTEEELNFIYDRCSNKAARLEDVNLEDTPCYRLAHQVMHKIYESKEAQESC